MRQLHRCVDREVVFEPCAASNAGQLHPHIRVLQEVQPKKARRVEGSKDDIFALGQPKARRLDLLHSNLCDHKITIVWLHHTCMC